MIKGAKHVAEALKVNTSLNQIYLFSNNIGDEGTKHVAEALKVNTSLKEMGLNCNTIGDDGAKQLAEALKVNNSLKEIALNWNNIGDEGKQLLRDAWREAGKNFELYVTTYGKKQNSSDSNLKPVDIITSINGQNVTSGNRLSNISSAKNCNRISYNVKELNTEWQDMFFIDKIQMASSAVVENNELEVSRLKIFENEYLYLYILQFIFLDARTIGRFQLTSHANKYWNHVALKGFKWGWRWNKIEAMLGKDKTDRLKNNFLKEIYLNNNNIGAEGAKHVAEALKVSTSLKWINLSGNNIRDKGAKHIADALKVNNSLERIWLLRNNIGVEGAKYLSGALNVNTSLKTFYLNGNNIRDEGAKHVAKAFKVGNLLKVVYLTNNKIGDEGEQLLRDAWRKSGKDGGLYV